MQFKNTKVYNFEGAFRGLRNPMNSWNRSDSYFGLTDIYNTDSRTNVIDSWVNYENIGEDNDEYYDKYEEYEKWLTIQGVLTSYDNICEVAFLGPNDLKLAQNLIRAGTDESKFMRQIFVSVDIVAPIYHWKEIDTYKVGTVANSTSTMHKLSSRPIEINDFSFDKEFRSHHMIQNIVKDCEFLRQKYIETRNKSYWRALIQLLPESYNQTRTWTANYAVLRNIYFARRNHKLQEWRDFCKWIEALPYSKELICLEDKK